MASLALACLLAFACACYILPPLAGALCAGAAARRLMPPGLSRAGVLAYLCAAGVLAAFAAAALTPRMRAVVFAMFRRAEPSVA